MEKEKKKEVFLSSCTPLKHSPKKNTFHWKIRKPKYNNKKITNNIKILKLENEMKLKN
jgi:hypothetical protein